MEEQEIGIKMPLTDKQQQVIAFIEQEYLLNSNPPAIEVICERVDVRAETIRSWFKDEAFTTVLKVKCIPFEDTSKGVLTPQQLAVINCILDWNDTRSDKKKLQDFKVPFTTYQSWLRDPFFAAYVRERVNSLFASHGSEVMRAHLDMARAGKMDAIKLYYQMNGIYDERNQGVNVQKLVLSLVEIVTKHVRDPDTINAIAEDLGRQLGLEAPDSSAFNSNTISGQVVKKEAVPIGF